MRLLFVKLRHIGDALLLTPTLAAVKQVLPKCEIWVIVRKGSEGILAGCPHIDELRGAMIPEHGAAREEHRGADRRLLGELRSAGFEHAFELSGGDRGRWMTLLSGARGRTANTTSSQFPAWWKAGFNRPSTTRRRGHHEIQRDYLTVGDVLLLPEEIPPFRHGPQATVRQCFRIGGSRVMDRDGRLRFCQWSGPRGARPPSSNEVRKHER